LRSLLAISNINASVGKSLAIYLDTNGSGPYAATFTVSTGSNMSDIHLYQNRIAVRCDNSCSLTNTNIDYWDKDNDSDIHAVVSSGALTVDNDWKLKVVADTFSPGGNVTMSTGGSYSYSGDLEIVSGASLDMSSYTLSISGNYLNSGTVILSSNTTLFTKNSGTQTLNSGGTGAGKSFYNLTHSGTGILQLSGSALDIDGVFTNSNGTFDANNLNVNVADDFLISGGYFTPKNGGGATTQTVTFDGTAEATISGSTTFNHLTMDTTTDGAKTIKFTAGTTQTINGTWTLDGAEDKVLTLRSTSDNSAWYWTISADINPSGDYIDVKDSQSTNSYRITAGANCIDSGNNEPGWIFITNNPPNSPSSLAQKKTTDVEITVGGWTNESERVVKFTATVSDPDSDQVRLCVEKDPLGTAFSGTEDLCGDLVDSGQIASVTISSQTDATEYHWQVRAKDENDEYSVSWVSYPDSTPNGENERDYGIDTTAPTGGTVKDGTTSGGDLDWNADGSLTQLLANWTSTEPNSDISGLQKYEYALRRSPDNYYWTPGSPGSWGVGEYWYNNGTDTSFTASSLNLQTGVLYYISLKTTDNASNSATINSNGIQVSPTLGFSLSDNAIPFDDLNDANDWTDSKNGTVTTSTNAANGYSVFAYITDYLRSLVYTEKYVDDFQGKYTSPPPETWELGEYGFGYTTSDPDVNSGKFVGNKYAAFSHDPPGDAVADHTDPINGQTGAVSGEEFTITYKVAVSTSQVASDYQTFAIYIVTANY